MGEESVIRGLEGLLGIEIPLWRDEAGVKQEDTNFPCYATDASGRVTYLNLSGSGIRELPPAVGTLNRLQTIRLLHNELSDLPDELGGLPQLKRLYMPRNRFTELPEVVLRLRSLEVLAVNGNRITALPDWILELVRLGTLGLGNNLFREVPSVLALMPSLRALYMGGNPVNILPEWIGDMTNLTRLHLDGTSISVLPSSLARLQQLRSVSIAHTKVDSIDQLVELACLRTLDVRGAALSALPDRITDLEYLEDLDLSETDLVKMPSGVGKLQSLRYLGLSGLQKLAELPSGLFELTGLQRLTLSGTQLASIPPEIERLQGLIVLDLSSMGLSSVPPAVFMLGNLRLLNLSSNRLRELPPEIIKCQLAMTWSVGKPPEGLLLMGNPVESPPYEVLRRGRSAVEAYFRSLRTEQKAIDEVKVLLVGDGGCGKTSLVKRLLGRPFDKDEPTTHGIRIEEHVLDYSNRRIKARVWDFGGQEIMHATHQFFLSKRSAYILVVDGRRDEKTEYWLKHVEAFGGDSPILIAVNKIDLNRSFDINRRFLMEKYRGIRDVIRVSCANGEGIDLLENALSTVLARLDHARTVWPSSWFRVKERMESLREDFISFKEFRRTCESEAITDPMEQEVLAEFLHDLGAILWFTDLPLQDTNVINPRWLTEGVYHIVNSDEVARAGGVVVLDSLRHILPQRTHPPEKHHFIIEIMKKFELCYQIDEHQVLLPALLPIEEPSISIGEGDVVRFQVDYDFLPKSILPRLIVRMQNDIEGSLRWRSGVVLQSRSVEARAIIKVDEAERRIALSTYGNARREYLGVVLHELRDLNGSFERLRAVERVPMPDRPDVTMTYAHLLRLEAKGVRTYIPDGTDKEYDVHALLGYLKPPRKTEDEMIDLLRRLVEKGDTPETLAEKANRALILQPTVLGLGVNVNELIRQVLSAREHKGKKKSA